MSASMNAFQPNSFPFADNRKAAQGGLGSMCCFGCAAVWNNEFHNCNLEWIAVRLVEWLQLVSSASECSAKNMEAVESINEKFLNRERLDQIATAHARNSQPACWNDCTAFLHRKMNLFARCSVSSLRETRASLSKVFAFLFLSLKINHLRRLPPDQAL